MYTSNTEAEEENLKINYIYINRLNGLFKNVDCTLTRKLLTADSEGYGAGGRVFLDFIELRLYIEWLNMTTPSGDLVKYINLNFRAQFCTLP